MIINAIRFRTPGDETWETFKLNLGSGRFRNYQALVADPKTLTRVVLALEYLLQGKDPSVAMEAQAQLSDDGGHTWTVHRRDGLTRYLKDGAVLDASIGEKSLAAALMDLDGLGADGPHASIGLQRFEIKAAKGKLSLVPFGLVDDPEAALRQAVERQIVEIASGSAKLVDVAAFANPRVLARTVRALEPIYIQYRELCRQHHDLGGGPDLADAPDVEALAAEVALAESITEAAAPLLAPAAPTVKSLKDDIAKADAAIAETTHRLGLTASDGATGPRDFRKAIEALARLEAYAKLVRASQGARKYCEQNIEPLYKRYLEQAESSLAGDRQIAGELESCLASLTLRLRHKAEASAAESDGPALGVKTWFDRFKTRQTDDEPKAADDRSEQDLETARMAIEYALGRLNDLGQSLGAAYSRHESVRAKLDEGHEDLVKSYARLQSHWITIARESQLPEDLDLNGLLKIVAGHGQLVAWNDKRQALIESLSHQTARLSRLSRLLLDWRKTTGSQKSADLGNTQALLQEARDVARYLEPKKKLLAQARATSTAARASGAVKALLQTRRDALLAQWRDAARDVGGLDIRHAALGDLFQRAGVLRALALVHGASTPPPTTRLFDIATEGQAATLYLWSKPQASPEERLELVHQLETAQGGELRLLLLADESLGAMLASVGIGMAHRLKDQPKATEKLPAPSAPRVAIDARPAARAATPVVAARDGAPRRNALLTEKALRTLDLLNNAKGR